MHTTLTQRHPALNGRIAVALVTSFVLAVLFAFSHTPPASADAPNLVSRNGITVHANRGISGRTIEADISTGLIHFQAINGPHRVRVVLPQGYYQNPGKRYPVLYLLHGGAGGSSSQWTTGGGAAEAIQGNRPVIIVTPDGGKVGWFTNWINPGNRSQRWWDFYINQLIPFIDGNLRTNATKNGRAIAGLSMGGFGAIRFAQDRPDLFRSVASFSGAQDLGDAGIRSVVTEQATQNGFPADGPFGAPFWPADGHWNNQNPLNKAAKLKGLQVLLYAGSGIHDADVLERTVGASTARLSGKLNAAGVPHLWMMYGRNVTVGGFRCDGGHNFGCWNGSLSDALPRMMTVLQGR